MRAPPHANVLDRASDVRLPLWRMVALVAAVFAAYANSLSVPFVFDDVVAVESNPTIRHLDLGALRPPNDGSTTTGRPLVNLSYAANYAVSGNVVWSYHAVNIALHALSALLVFGLVGETLRALRPPPAASADKVATWSAFLAALLWALHPLHTETVVTIAQRTELLCAAFYLLTLFAFARGARVQDAGAGGGTGWFSLAIAAAALGMASKEVMATAPVAVFLYDRAFLAGSAAAAWRRRSGWYLALGATWSVLLLLAFEARGARGASAGFGLGVTAWTYLLTQCRALFLYAKLACWPHPLVLDYGTAVVASLRDVASEGVVIVVALAITAWALVKNRPFGFAGAFVFLVLAPSSSVVPLVTQTIAEHRMYLPLVAVMSAAAVALAAWPRGREATVALALALGVLVVARNHTYRDPVAIWLDTVANYPEAARPHNNLALALQHAGREKDAEAQFGEAVRLDPRYVTAHFDYGMALLNRGEIDPAIQQFNAAVQLAPDHADAHVNLGVALVRAGRPAEAIPHFDTALRLSGGSDVEHDLAVAHAAVGLQFARTNQLEDAARHLSRAVELDAANIEARANLGNVRLLQGRPKDAIACYTEVLRRQPDDTRARENLAIAQQALRTAR